MRYRKYAILVVSMVVALLMGLVVSCAPAAEEEPIKVGGLLDLTGLGARFAVGIQQGIELKLDEVGREVMGRKIKMIYADTASSTDMAVTKMRKLVEVDKVDVVLGVVLSDLAKALAPYYADTNTLGIHFYGQVWEGSTELTRGNLFLNGPIVEKENDQLAQFAYEVMGWKTATVLVTDYIYGEYNSKAFISAFEELGGEVVQVQKVPFGTLDFSPYLLALKEADVFFGMEVQDWLGLIRQYREFGIAMPIIAGHEWLIDAAVIEELGDLIVGATLKQTYNPGLDTPENRAFRESFRAKHGVWPTANEEAGYNALHVYIEAVKATGGDTSTEAIKNALLTLEIRAPRGTVTYNAQSLYEGPIYVLQLVKENGEYVWKWVL